MGNMTEGSTLGFHDENRDEMIRKARELLPLFKKNAMKGDQDRRLPQENIDALHNAGLMDIVTPISLGGQGASWTTLILVTMEIAKVDPATAWVFNLMTTGGWFATLYPKRIREVLFKDGGNPMTCGSITPQGSMEKTDGGYLLTGKFYYMTGCYHSKWAICPTFLKNPDGSLTPGAYCVVPMSDIVIEDSWDTVGMRGTGSACVVADKTFVPDLMVVLPGEFGAEPKEQRDPSDNWALWAMLITMKTSVAVAAVEGMFEHVRSVAHKRGITYSTFANIADSQVAVYEIGRAGAAASIGRTILIRSCEVFDRSSALGITMSVEERTRYGAEGAMCVEMLREAADHLMTVYGAGAFASRDPMQRLWKDMNTITRHNMAVSTMRIESYGRATLGIEPNNFGENYF